jgi:acetylornithine deacetylase/succinyl-diaminopimelate desuccinylase-like protein
MTTQIDRIIGSTRFHHAAAILAAEHDRTVRDIIELTEIPSPPFAESARAARYQHLLREHGLDAVEQDEVGNVMGIRRGTGNGPLLVVAAHLDTVFPAGTNVAVRREGTKLFAPGIGDDTRSLAVLLAFMRAMDQAGIETRGDILFVGDVGEEGLGDLRGMRYLFQHGRYKDRITGFITVDSPEMETIVTGGVGSKRFHVVFNGPGGHSLGAFGIVNPLYALCQAASELARVEVPTSPRTTHTVALCGGGTSINAIPNQVWMDVDLRSEDAAELLRLEQRFDAILERAVADENAARDTSAGRISLEKQPLGDRPAGRTAPESDLVQAATRAMAAHGFKPRHVVSSTDANIPMSLGIPAIKIGSGGSGGRAHSLEEWIDVEPVESLRGMRAGLATILAAAGMLL